MLMLHWLSDLQSLQIRCIAGLTCESIVQPASRCEGLIGLTSGVSSSILLGHLMKRHVHISEHRFVFWTAEGRSGGFQGNADREQNRCCARTGAGNITRLSSLYKKRKDRDKTDADMNQIRFDLTDVLQSHVHSCAWIINSALDNCPTGFIKSVCVPTCRWNEMEITKMVVSTVVHCDGVCSRLIP